MSSAVIDVHTHIAHGAAGVRPIRKVELAWLPHSWMSVTQVQTSGKSVSATITPEAEVVPGTSRTVQSVGAKTTAVPLVCTKPLNILGAGLFESQAASRATRATATAAVRCMRGLPGWRSIPAAG